ncbi:MAG TPA: hypothetical protein VL171_18830 [Verrucomicrobiae bacterium]|nr:hypothetical protein [Verrucomicrobiae bacterium]
MNDPTPVKITEVEIPFQKLIVFFFTCGLAAIPAVLLLAALIFVVLAFLGGLAGTFHP